MSTSSPVPPPPAPACPYGVPYRRPFDPFSEAQLVVLAELGELSKDTGGVLEPERVGVDVYERGDALGLHVRGEQEAVGTARAEQLLHFVRHVDLVIRAAGSGVCKACARRVRGEWSREG